VLVQLGGYQEEGQLLDPHLDSIITPLAALLHEQAIAAEAAALELTQNISKLLWTVASVRLAPD
jgi:hypothetical protein